MEWTVCSCWCSATRFLVPLALVGCAIAYGQQGTVMPRVRLEDARAAPIASERSCTIVFLDGHFYSEEETHKIGEFRQGEVTEGELSPQELQKLNQILDSNEFVALKSPQEEKTVMREEQHLVQVTVPRADGLQDLVYESDKARKPAAATLKPLFDWWKAFNKSHPPKTRTQQMNNCEWKPK